MNKSFEQPHLDPTSELYKSGFRIPESNVGVEVLEAEEMPNIKTQDVFALSEETGFYLPQEAIPSHEVQEKRKGYLQKLLDLPFVERAREKSKEISRVVDRVLSKTLEYYLAVVPFLPYKGRVEQFLDDKLENFDPEEMRRLREKPLLNVKLVSRYLKRKDFLGAYEAFWGTWNPQPHTAARSVYDALGGNEKPVTATAGSFLYSGVFLHSFHPYLLPIYAIEAAAGKPEMIAANAALVTGAYVALGIPVLVRKGIESFKKKHKDNIPKFAAKPEQGLERA